MYNFNKHAKLLSFKFAYMDVCFVCVCVVYEHVYFGSMKNDIRWFKNNFFVDLFLLFLEEFRFFLTLLFRNCPIKMLQNAFYLKEKIVIL